MFACWTSPENAIPKNNLMMNLYTRIFEGAFIYGHHGEKIYENIYFSFIMFSINPFVYNAHMPGGKLYWNLNLNWTNINVYHVSTMLKYVTVSFRSLKTSRLYLLWRQFPQTFYVWTLMWQKMFFPEVFVRHTCLVFVCVCTSNNLLVLNTEVNFLCIWTQ